MPRLDTNPPIHVVPMVAKRTLLCAFVVLAAYNPSGNSYVHWVLSSEHISPLQICIGIALLTALVILTRMAYLSIKYFGIVAFSLLIMMSITFCVGLGLFAFQDVEITAYMVQFWTIMILGFGNTWAFVWKRISGERDVVRSPP